MIRRAARAREDRPIRRLLLVAIGAAALSGLDVPRPALAATDAALSAAYSLHTRGCDTHVGLHSPLRHNRTLDEAARRWASGARLRSAIEASGYREDQSAALHVSGEAAALRPALVQDLCTALTDPRFRDIGSSERGRDTWIILAAPFVAPAGSATTIAVALVRQINAARRSPRRCGHRTFPPAPPVRLDTLLNLAAAAHAEDMLRHDYFAHEDLAGGTPANRIAATGYRYRLIGENIAFGPQTVAQAVQGWLESPGHCENIMDPRFQDTGVAYASNRSGAPRIYWVQDFAAPLRPAPR